MRYGQETKIVSRQFYYITDKQSRGNMHIYSCFIQILLKNAKKCYFLILILHINIFFFKTLPFVYMQNLIISTLNKKISIRTKCVV